MMKNRFSRSLARGCALRWQRGIAAVEFAIVFPVFFVIFYGLVTYGLIFVAQQSLTLAAEEGARAALRYSSTSNPSTIACDTAKSVVSWLGTGIVTCTASNPAINCPYPAGNTTAKCIKVSVAYPYQTNPLIPLLLGPLMNVAVPTQIGSSATVQLE